MKNKGTIVKRSRLRDSTHRVDEAGVSLRKKGKLKRRVYNVKAPNKLWHIDTIHKLVSFVQLMVLADFQFFWSVLGIKKSESK